MYNFIALHFDTQTLKGIAIGFGGFVLLLLIVASILKPFFSQRQRYYDRRRRNPIGGFMVSVVIIFFLLGGLKNCSPYSSEGYSTKEESSKTQDSKGKKFDHRAGGDIFFEGEQHPQKNEENDTVEKDIPSDYEQPLEQRMRVNQRPSHSKMNTSPEAKRVESSASNMARTYAPESNIYYIQLSAAQTLDDGQRSVAEQEVLYAQQVFLAKIIDDQTGSPFKVLLGPFPSRLTAFSAIDNEAGIIRTELDNDLVFIDY